MVYDWFYLFVFDLDNWFGVFVGVVVGLMWVVNSCFVVFKLMIFFLVGSV